MAESVQDAPAQLQDQILTDRFEVVNEPLGWRCRSCRCEVLGDPTVSVESALNRLAESAADHALFCGRCDD